MRGVETSARRRCGPRLLTGNLGRLGSTWPLCRYSGSGLLALGLQNSSFVPNSYRSADMFLCDINCGGIPLEQGERVRGFSGYADYSIMYDYVYAQNDTRIVLE